MRRLAVLRRKRTRHVPTLNRQRSVLPWRRLVSPTGRRPIARSMRSRSRRFSRRSCLSASGSTTTRQGGGSACSPQSPLGLCPLDAFAGVDAAHGLGVGGALLVGVGLVIPGRGEQVRQVGGVGNAAENIAGHCDRLVRQLVDEFVELGPGHGGYATPPPASSG